MDCNNSPAAWDLDRKGSTLTNTGLNNGFFRATTPAVLHIRQNAGPYRPSGWEFCGEKPAALSPPGS